MRREWPAKFLRRAGNGFTATTWMDENRALFRALSLEKLVTALFIGLITFVAGLNILVVLTMTVTDRARDIAVLMAMGARRRQVRQIFVLAGSCRERGGNACGLAPGLFLFLDRRPVAIDPAQSGGVRHPLRAVSCQRLRRRVDTAAALAISIAATILPARSAARILPVEILRFE